MRIISTLELDHVSGGEGATVHVTGHNIDGSKKAQGTDFSAYTTEDTPMEASNGGKTMSQAGKIALEALACSAAVNKGKKSPTWTNAAKAAAACSTAAQDVYAAIEDYGKTHPELVKAMTIKPVP